MKLTCLGSAGGYPSGKNGTTSYLVTSQDGAYTFLLDAGSGSALALEQQMDVSDLNAIVITHDHADHTADLGIYQHLLMLRQPLAKHAPVPIYLHPNAKVRNLLMVGETSEPQAYQPDEVLDLGAFRLSFCLTVHPIECYAVRIEEIATGEVLVFTADSGWCDALVPFSQNADVLLADCAFPNEVGSNCIHLIAQEVAQLANEAQVKQVIASHMAPQADAGLILAQIRESLDAKISLVKAEPGAVYAVRQ